MAKCPRDANWRSPVEEAGSRTGLALPSNSRAGCCTDGDIAAATDLANSE